MKKIKIVLTAFVMLLATSSFAREPEKVSAVVKAAFENDFSQLTWLALEKSFSNAAFTSGVTFSGSPANEVTANSITIAVKTILNFFITILFFVYNNCLMTGSFNFNLKVIMRFFR